MNVTASNAVSFSATTKQGNEYKKANGGKTVGLISGAGASTYIALKAKKEGLEQFTNNALGILKKMDEKKPFSDATKEAIEKFFDNAKNIKKFAIGSYAAVAVIITGTAVALGAIVDKFVNHHRKHKADKAAHAE